MSNIVNISKLTNNLKISNKNKIKSTYNKKDNNDIYDILSQDSFLMLNRKLYSVLGLELATFITFLIDKEKYYKNNYKLDNEGYFYITNSDLLLHTGIKASRINSQKNEAIKKELLYIKKAGIPLKTYYKVNIDKIREIIYNSKSSLDLAYNRLINDENINLEDLHSFSISTLEQKTYRDLRLICKNLKISYSGKDTKSSLIEKIMFQAEKPKTDTLVVEQVDENYTTLDENTLRKYTNLSLREICKNLKIPYSGKDIKSSLIEKIMSKLNLNSKEDTTDIEKVKNLILSFDGLDLNWNSYLENIISSFLKKHKLSLTLEYLTSNYKNVMANSLIQNKAGCFISLLKKEQRQINSLDTNKENLVVEQVDENKENLVVEQVDENKENLVVEQVDTNKENLVVEQVDTNKENLVVEQVDTNKENLVVEQVDENKENLVVEQVDEKEKLFDLFKNSSEFEKQKIEEKAILNYIADKNLNKEDTIKSLINLKNINEDYYYITLKKYIFEYI